MMEHYSILIAPFFGALFAVSVCIPLVRKLACAINFFDKPGGRKDHVEPVPPIGGLVILPIFMAALYFITGDLAHYWPLYTALALILLVGGIDDYKHINPWPRFVAQFAAAALVVLPGQVQLVHLGDLFGLGVFELGFMSIPFSIVAVVLLINAINLMDGLDGLVGGKTFVIFIWLAVAAFVAGDMDKLLPLVPLIGALLAFLAYNMRHPLRDRASIFLGDAGSMGLGVVIAWFAIGFAQDPAPVLEPISIAWILALPIFDICAQFYRRAREGRHPFSADRGHFHHHFIHAGFNVGHSTTLILLIAFMLGGVGVGGVMFGVPLWTLTSLWIVLLFSHMALSLRPKTYITFFNQFTDEEK